MTFYSLGISFKIIASLFVIKVLAGFAIWKYYEYNNTGTPNCDSIIFIKDAYILNQVWHTSLLDYLKLLTGFYDPATGIETKYLNNSAFWFLSRTSGYYNDNRAFVRVLSVIQFITTKNVYAIIVVLNFLSFSGLVAIYKAFKKYIHHHQLFLFAILLTPSLLFWGSGVLKENLMLFAIGGFIYSMTVIQHGLKFKYILSLLFFLICCLAIKLYVFAALFIPLCLLFFLQKTTNKKIVLTYLSMILVGLMALLFSNRLFPKKGLTSMISKQNNVFRNFARGGYYFLDNKFYTRIPYEGIDSRITKVDSNKYTFKKGIQFMYWKEDSMNDTLYQNFNEDTSTVHTLVIKNAAPKTRIEIANVQNTSNSILLNSPRSFINGLFRPFITDFTNALNIFFGLELILIYGTMILLISYSSKLKYNLNFILFNLIVISSLCILIGITTPIIGALVRYRIPVFIFLWAMVLSMVKLEIKHPKWKAFLDKIKHFS